MNSNVGCTAARQIALTRRNVLAGGAAALAQLASPRDAARAAGIAPRGKLTLAWHTNIAPRWLDPQQHDGTASPDNFLMALHDGLTKNFRDELYDHLALAERFELAKDARSATFWLRAGTKFHDGTLVTPADVKWSYEHYRGAWREVLKANTGGVEIVDDRTVRFHFNDPFLDFPILLGTGNACGAGWVVPAKYYEQTGPAGFVQKPVGAGPYRLVSQEPGVRLEFAAFTDYYRPIHIKQLTMLSVPEATTRVAMVERGEADIMYFVPGELIDRVKNNPKLRLAPIVSATGGCNSLVSRIHPTRSTTSACVRRSAWRSIAMRSTRLNAVAWVWWTATGSTTTSSMAWNGRSGRTISPRRSS
jgi:peptide/nickel transport system substrate-binding protein